MKRNCPNCKKNTISVFKLMTIRPKCRNCKEKIGHHWLLNAIFICVHTFIQLIAAIILINADLNFWFGVCVFIFVLLGGIFIWALAGPLETKNSILEP